GYPPYHPRMMVKVLVYGYCTGTYASRRLAAKLIEDVAYRYLAAGNQPDFRTISDFRKEHGGALSGLFEQVLKLCQKAGLVKLGRASRPRKKPPWRGRETPHGSARSSAADGGSAARRPRCQIPSRRSLHRKRSATSPIPTPRCRRRRTGSSRDTRRTWRWTSW